MIQQVATLNNIFWFFVISVIVMVLSQFVVGIKLSTSGQDLTHLEQRWIKVVQENQKLRENVALHASLSQINTSAEILGLREPQNVIYLTPVQDQTFVSSSENLQ